jgi:hypothetical protein
MARYLADYLREELAQMPLPVSGEGIAEGTVSSFLLLHLQEGQGQEDYCPVLLDIELRLNRIKGYRALPRLRVALQATARRRWHKADAMGRPRKFNELHD